jgi:hypothetical protein
MQREDLVVKFGALRHPQPNLQALTAVVAENENVRSRLVHGSWVRDLLTISQKAIGVLVRRPGADGLIALRLTPRQGWGGRGSLGYVSRFPMRESRPIDDIDSCHLVPYASP